MTEKTQNNADPSISVKIVLPLFCPKNPENWLRAVEKKFQAEKITNDDTKFSYFVESYDPQRNYIIKDVRIIMQVKSLGYLKPSQYLKKLYCELRHILKADQIRLVWQSRLPEEIRKIFEAYKTTKMDELMRKVRDFEKSRNYSWWLVQNVRTQMTEIKAVEIELYRKSKEIATRRWWRELKEDAGNFFGILVDFIGTVMTLHSARGARKFKLVKPEIYNPCHFRKVRCRFIITDD